MADIKIRKTPQETTLEANGIESVDMELVKTLFASEEKSGVLNVFLPDLGEGMEDPFAKDGDETEAEAEEAGRAVVRSMAKYSITPEQLKIAKAAGKLDTVLHPFDEIDVPLDTGGVVTVVCGYVSPTWARFVLKDCWCEGEMNEECTNKGGYYHSKARKRILDEILPHIAKEWRDIMKARGLVEHIDGEEVTYEDLMWLPSATDVFGAPEGRWWKDEPDSFQLPIFRRERDRVKELDDKGTYHWWLRSVRATNAYGFCFVITGGSANGSYAYDSYGFAPGFDI